MYSNYGKLSTELYDFTKPVATSIQGDIEYYVKRLGNTKGRILEAGVGSGRVLIPLLEKGYTIDGVDESSDMLQSCQSRCQKRNLTTELFEMKLEELKLPHSYEVIIMPTGTFCLINSYQQAIRVLTKFKQHLSYGGRIIIDLLFPYDFKEGEMTIQSFPFSADEGITLESKALHIDWLKQTTSSLLKYEKWQKGRLIETELQEFTLRWYGIEEFTHMLKDVGFQHIVCSANYQYNVRPTNSEQIITFEAEVR